MRLQRAVGAMVLLFLIEHSVMPWVIPEAWIGRIVPHFVFVFVLYAALYRSRHTALLLGMAFGIVQDIVFYGHLLGVHCFSMGICGYLTGLLLENRRAPLMMALSVIGMGSLLYDGITFLIYRAFQLTSLLYADALMVYMMPSLFLQLGFALAVYVPARRWFEGSVKPPAEEDG